MGKVNPWFQLDGYAKSSDGTKIFIPVYDMKNNQGRLNDQKPKPKLGNIPELHGKINTDNAGGSVPSKNRPIKTNK